VKYAAAIACAFVHCAVLGGSAIAAGNALGWSAGLTCAVFIAATISGLVPFKREVALSVLLGYTFGWGVAFAAMAVLAPLLMYIESIGKRSMRRMPQQSTSATK